MRAPKLQADCFEDLMLADSEFIISEVLALMMQPIPSMEDDRKDEAFTEQAQGRHQSVVEPDSGEVQSTDTRMIETEPTRHITPGLGPPKRYFRRFWIGISTRALRLHNGVNVPRPAGP